MDSANIPVSAPQTVNGNSLSSPVGDPQHRNITVLTLNKNDGCTKVWLAQRKRPVSTEHIELPNSGATTPKLLKLNMPSNQGNTFNNSNNVKSKKKKKNTNGKNNVKNLEGEDTEVSESETSQVDSPEIIPMDFQTEVRLTLKQINEALTGDGKSVSGLVKCVKDIESDLYGGDKPEKGLKSRMGELEKKFNKCTVTPAAVTTSTVGSVQSDTVSKLQEKVSRLEQCNQVLLGVADKLQCKNKTLQNQLYVQKDHQNYLNLHLGGVHECEGKSIKEEVVAFFHDILEMTEVSEADIVKAHRKSEAREYEDTIEDDAGHAVTLQVVAPGVTFVRLQSEIIREQAMAKARLLGGKRHPEHNHKYFVAPVECEATKATKSKYKGKVRNLVQDNKAKMKKDTFYFQGENFYVNGELQQDAITPPHVCRNRPCSYS